MKNKKNIVRDGYNAMSQEYLAARHKDSEDVRLLERLTDRLSPGARILDAGCGAGIPITQLLSQDFDVVGVDFAEEQIKLARRMVPKAEFVCADLTALTLADESFDAVCSYYAIIHIPRESHRDIFQHFHRLLVPDGWALLCLGAEDLEDDFCDDYMGVKMYWSHYDVETYLGILADCGFVLHWSRVVQDASCPTASHLFVLVQKE